MRGWLDSTAVLKHLSGRAVPEVALQGRGCGGSCATLSQAASKHSGVVDVALLLMTWQGRLTNGKVFDSSHNNRKAFSFTLGAGRVINGWEDGLLNMW
mmetsp:Transcript_3222/g.9155  ORF Transcript_3222/g.9155 Transcript_3222/m.9155 type:complete len:98 (-) Transcript_3222:291-584(-)